MAISAADITRLMLEKDAFTRWLGAELVDIQEGYCRLQMTIRTEMCNGLGLAHGGITYSLADSALAFASNSRGKKAVSIETAISHLLPLYPGDRIVATAQEKSLRNHIALYEVNVEKEGTLVALFKGTVYRKEQYW